MTASASARGARDFAVVAAVALLVAAVLARYVMADWPSSYAKTVLAPLFRLAATPITALRDATLGASPLAILPVDLAAWFVPEAAGVRRTKLPAFLFEPLIAVAAFLLVRAAGSDPRRALATAGAVLIAPTTLLNGAMIGWADAAWAGFVLICVLAVIGERSRLAAASFAVGAGFGAPALMLAPFLAVAARRGQFDWLALYVALLVIAFVAALGLLVGRPVPASLLQALGLLDPPAGTSGVAPSLYMALTPERSDVTIPFAIAGFALVVVAMAAVAGRRREPMSAPLVCLTAYVFAAAAAFGLPRASARFTFAADLLAIVLAGMNPAWIPLALVQQLVSVLAYAPEAFGVAEAGALAGTINVVLVPWAIARWLALVDPDGIGLRLPVPSAGAMVRACVAVVVAFVAWILAVRLLAGVGLDGRLLWPERRVDVAGLITFLFVAAAIFPLLTMFEDHAWSWRRNPPPPTDREPDPR